MPAQQRFARVMQLLSEGRQIELGAGKGFGSGALKIRGKIFAMLSSKKQFVVKLSKQRVEEFVSAGVGERFEPRPGKPMKEWLVVTGARADWAKLAKEACEFVSGGTS